MSHRNGETVFKKATWPAVGPHTERKVLPAGDSLAVKEEAWNYYGDNGIVRESTQFIVMTERATDVDPSRRQEMGRCA